MIRMSEEERVGVLVAFLMIVVAVAIIAVGLSGCLPD
jgi:hypothetical protein